MEVVNKTKSANVSGRSASVGAPKLKSSQTISHHSNIKDARDAYQLPQPTTTHSVTMFDPTIHKPPRVD